MTTIGIFGTGNMGEAIIKSLLSSGIDRQRILASEVKKDRAEHIARLYGIITDKSPEAILKEARYIILAVKPQDAKELLQEMASLLKESQIIVSIMAGVTTSNILSLAGKPVKVIRAMPNIAAKVGEGAIGITHNSMVEAREFEELLQLFAPLGRVVEVREELMDAVTALGGSGPAFFLLFLESMIDAGVKTGIPRDKATIISLQVAKGVLKMLEEEKIHPTVMREMITSPAGTTISGLAVLEERGFRGTIIRAVDDARKRAKELSL